MSAVLEMLFGDVSRGLIYFVQNIFINTDSRESTRGTAVRIVDFLIPSVDGSEIPNNHLGCIFKAL